MVDNAPTNESSETKPDIMIDTRQIDMLAKQEFQSIRAPQGFGVYASSGENYQYAIFGRDSIETGEDLLSIDSELTKEILIAMASMQGTKKNERTEEEFGKIHHEYRAVEMDGVSVPEKSKRIIKNLSSRWGGSDDMFRYYGSVDSTPLFVRLVERYVLRYGPDILGEEVEDVDGGIRPFVDHVHSAAEWVKNSIKASSWGLLEFKRANPEGLPYQAWKDSQTGYLHLDGTVAAADSGIASVEVQGYAYDALMAASKLKILTVDENDEYVSLARKLQENVLKLMWIDDGEKPYFAIGLDRDDGGATRQIMTCTSNTAAILDSNLLLDLPEIDRIKYVQPIVDIIMGEDFITDIGVRTRSLKHKDLIGFADYHGSLVSWPKETNDIAKGLRRHGFPDQAAELENRLLMAAQKSNDFYEFYYVDSLGNVTYNYDRGGSDQYHTSEGAISIPEQCQAWTISAVMRALDYRKQ